MIRKFCRLFCVVFLIGDFQASFSQFDTKNVNHFNPSTINGSIALLDNAMHQASIRLISEDNVAFGEGHICSGSLISPRVVLTAARCLFNLNFKTPRHPSELIAVMGTTDRYQRTLDTIISRITHIRYPASFDLESMRDDIALLFLSSEIPENHSTIRPIDLQWKITDNYVRGSVTGWEVLNNGGFSRQLLIGNVSVLERDSCQNNFEQPQMTTRMICAKYNNGINGKICQSDAGAALVHEGKQIGLASWRTSNCSTNTEQLTVYTNVTYYKEWIRAELADGSNTDSSFWGFLGCLILTWFAVRSKQQYAF